jgi:hypothetical protein
MLGGGMLVSWRGGSSDEGDAVTRVTSTSMSSSSYNFGTFGSSPGPEELDVLAGGVRGAAAGAGAGATGVVPGLGFARATFAAGDTRRVREDSHSTRATTTRMAMAIPTPKRPIV